MQKMMRYILFLALSLNAFAELRPVSHASSERIQFFVKEDDGEPSLVYKFDGKLMGEVPHFGADWTWHTTKPENTILEVQYSAGGKYFTIIFQAGRIMVGESFYECDYFTGQLVCRDDQILKMCKELRTDQRLKTFPTSPNTTGYDFVGWIDHNTFILEIRTAKSKYHSYCRFRGKGEKTSVRSLNVFEYIPGD